jgi:hypothetical protein
LFKLPAKPGESPESDILEHDFSMRFSRCFTASGGKLTCLTSHDPHTVPAAERKAAYYREKCLQCHRDANCRIPAAERARRNQNDCAGCHMLQRDLTTFSHSALTNHRIVRKSGQPYPDSAYRLTTAGLPQSGLRKPSISRTADCWSYVVVCSQEVMPMPAPARATKSTTKTLSPEERIRRRAYELYVQRGNQSGSELDDWLQAEKEFLQDEAIDEKAAEMFGQP